MKSIQVQWVVMVASLH